MLGFRKSYKLGHPWSPLSPAGQNLLQICFLTIQNHSLTSKICFELGLDCLFCWEIISPTYLCFILLSVLVLHFDRVIKQNNQTNQMQITTIYNYQETCISCTLQCQELGATGRQLSFKLCCSCDTARTMCLCVFNNHQYPKYILSYLILTQDVS